MVSFTIAAASALLALSPLQVERPTAVALAAAPDIVTVKDHLDSARRALAVGAFDVARREYVIAVALDRDAGRVPTEAAIGLAHCLFSQTFNREAAMVLNQLAGDAAKAGDVESEARALADAVWLNTDSRQYRQAREDAIRLRVLSRDKRLTDGTRQLIKARIG